eukprot:TRINITY_DN1724_c0_g1_i5.p1 TRINITY_DN1724_c0_g1~~TRINITY_DN1724_c0_g1_i5.p1  ORF type:complete len:169 (+),score=16.80 TRINITY_DN1724_c0_g1_i5:237-743(+)
MASVPGRFQPAEWWQTNRAQVKPWVRFADTRSMSFPQGDQIVSRIQRNLVYFQANYTLTAAGLLAFFILIEPSFLIGVLVISAAYYYLLHLKSPLTVGPKTLDETERLVAFVAITSLSLWIFSVGADILYVAFLVASVTLAHASLYEPIGEAHGDMMREFYEDDNSSV